GGGERRWTAGAAALARLGLVRRLGADRARLAPPPIRPAAGPRPSRYLTRLGLSRLRPPCPWPGLRLPGLCVRGL
ncbi:hypothetical protein, partial [Jiangella asiatica]|uniref:hypothetical protein n=1 Tax=Jiangella asiatica TaxID=2530372 RepID=UPI00193E9FB3